MPVEFRGRDLVVHFKENAVNVGIRQYRVEYRCAISTVTHYVKEEDSQGSDGEGRRLYKDALSYGENEAAGLTRTPQVTLYAQNAAGDWSSGVVIDANNGYPVIPGNINVTPTLDGCMVRLQTPVDTDFEGFVAWVGATAEFALDSASERFRGKAGTFNVYLPDKEVYYLRIAPYDLFGLNTQLATSAIPIVRADRKAMIGGVFDLDELLIGDSAPGKTILSDLQQRLADNEQGVIGVREDMQIGDDEISARLATETILRQAGDIAQGANALTLKAEVRDPVTGLSSRATIEQVEAVEANFEEAITHVEDRLTSVVDDKINPIQAQLTEQAGTIATLDGKTKAYWEVLADAGGSGQAFVAVKAEGDNGEETSDVGIGAHRVSVFNPSTNGWDKVVGVQGGAVTIFGSNNNLVANGAAEQGNTFGWSTTPTHIAGAGGSLSVVNTNPHLGDYCFRIAKTGTNGAGFQARRIGVLPGTSYTFRVAYRGNAATAAGFYFRVFTNTAPGADYLPSGSPFNDLVFDGPITTGWQIAELPWVCPAGVRWAAPAIYNWQAGPSELFFDTVCMFGQAGSVHIEDGSITADKLQIGSSSGARLTLDPNLMQVFDENNQLRVRLGVWD